MVTIILRTLSTKKSSRPSSRSLRSFFACLATYQPKTFCRLIAPNLTNRSKTQTKLIYTTLQKAQIMKLLFLSAPTIFQISKAIHLASKLSATQVLCLKYARHLLTQHSSIGPSSLLLVACTIPCHQMFVSQATKFLTENPP